VPFVAPRAARDPRTLDFVEALRASRSVWRRPVTAFDVVVTFESASGRRTQVEVRTRVETAEVDEAARRALVRALPRAARVDWSSVVVVLTAVERPAGNHRPSRGRAAAEPAARPAADVATHGRGHRADA
jgi:hypothetical protein